LSVMMVRRAQESTTDLEKSETRAHNQALRSAEMLARATQLRQLIENLRASRARLNIYPALAWGGMVMVLGVMTAVAAAQWMIESESRPSTVSVLATDIWGVGLRNTPT